MPVFPGTFVPTGVASTARFNHLIDDLMTPRIMSFRQICIHGEPAVLDPNDQLTWRVTFGNWLTAAPLRVRKNEVLIPDASVTNVDFVAGTFQAGAVTVDASGRPRDAVEAAYWFDYFPVATQEGLLTAAMSVVNMTAVGPPTTFTIETYPTNWEGVIIDVAFAMYMEKLLTDYNLWRYRLVFAIGPNEIDNGGGDIASQLETLKTNAEERSNRAMENEKFKTGNYLAPPTQFYYQGISGIGGSSFLQGTPVSGRLRGFRVNSFV